MSAQQALDKDCDTLSLVRDHVRILQLRLFEASGKAITDEAVDAISDLSNQLDDLMTCVGGFDAVVAKLSHEANLANDRLDARHERSLRYPYA